MKSHRPQLFIATFLFMLSLSACALLQDMSLVVGDFFRGNTKREQNNYGLNEKRTYRNEQFLKKIKTEEEQKEIIKRVEEE